MFRKLLLIIAICTIISIQLFAGGTGKLKGTVKDEDGKPLRFAKVILKDTKFKCQTEANGTFTLSKIPAGKYSLQIQYMNYAPYEEDSIKIETGKTVIRTILLKVCHTRSLSSEQIQEISVDDLLGVIPVQSHHNYVIYHVRGGKPVKVIFSADDVSVTDPIDGGGALSVDLNAVADMKVMTGGFTAEYGNAPSGMISFPSGNRPSSLASHTEKLDDSHFSHHPRHIRYYYPPLYNTEDYKAINPYPFIYAFTEPLSTFSIDVDTATYSNVRRMLNENQMPEPSYVRIEEMLNYFKYDYPEPENNLPFSVFQELGVCPWNTDHEILQIGLKGKTLSYDAAPPANLVFLLDVSGSMSDDNKLPLVKQAMKMLVNQMRPHDKIGIVTYSSRAGVMLNSTPVSQENTILQVIDELYAGGSTAGGAGLKLAYDLAEDNFSKEKNNRIILCTDGDFNVGAQSDDDMESLITEKREKGVFISVLGFGMGNIKDSKMEIIADKGNGNYYYINDLIEAKRVLVNEMSGTLNTIAKDVKIQIEFNPAKVRAYRLIGYENRALKNEDFKNDKIDAGEMGAGQTVTVLYEIVKNNSKELDPGEEELKYQKIEYSKEALESNELITLKFRYKDPHGNESKLISTVVKDTNIESNSTDFQFACSVAGFGMLLQKSKFREDLNWKDVYEMARKSLGKDADGYRKEFISLVKKAAFVSNHIEYRTEGMKRINK